MKQTSEAHVSPLWNGVIKDRRWAVRVFSEALPRAGSLTPAEAVDLGQASLVLELSAEPVIEALLRAEEDARWRPAARILRGCLLHRQGEDHAAEAVLQLASEETGFSSLPGEEVMFLLRQTASRDARGALDKIALARSEGAGSYAHEVLKALCLARLRRLDEAVVASTGAADAAPADEALKIRRLAARLAMMAGEQVQALAWYRLALRSDNGPAVDYFRGARAALACGEWTDAAAWLSRARDVQRFQTAAVDCQLGITFLRRHQFDRALAAFESALEKEPDNRPVKILKAETLLNAGKPAQVVDLLEPVVAAHPQAVEARLWLARALRALGHHQAALNQATDLVETGGLLADAQLVRGDALADLGDVAGALAAYRAVLVLRPGDEHALSRSNILMEKVSSVAEPSQKSIKDAETLFVREALSRPLPPMFAPRWTARDLAPARRWHIALLTHLRVVWAVLLRETRTRFGRRRAGYLWALIEPGIQIALFLLIFIVLRGREGVFGMSTAMFLTTGIIPFMFFQKTYRQVSSAATGNKALLGFPQVKVFDLTMARALLEGATYILVFIVFLGILAYWEGGTVLPVNLLEVLAALILLWAAGIGLGLIVQSIRPVMDSFSSTINAAVRLLYLTSGVIFAAAMLPQHLQVYVLYNPFMHLIEIVRHNFNPALQVDGVSIYYPLACFSIMLLFGLALDRTMREKMLER